MILLLIECFEKDRTMALVSPETYGLETWGMSQQKGIRQDDDGKWYFEWWSSGNEWIEDTNEELEINVLLETIDLDEVVSYVITNSPSEVQEILSEAKKIYNEYIDLRSHFLEESYK